MKIPGEKLKPYHLRRLDLEGNQIELIADFDTKQEGLDYWRNHGRLDQRWGLFHNGKEIPRSTK